ncbi:MAG: flavodoxin-dependent (E)-4-hydroxy-3-methylbut-2-enyl-diphosphate synthase, partial [Treponema sp.]|nr:flavodoxin-dependent (E)-4-hydroxy-3-methylbut-2-enyl-diphosphate synthase [Treponema sp.]
MSQLSRKITIGGCDGGGHIAALTIGGGFPVLLQTMWKDRLDILNLQETAERIESLSGIGCGLMRFAVPDMQAAEALGRLAQMVSMPLIADIHFDHTLALRCMDFPVAKIRINPGNIRSGAGGNDNVRAVVEKAAEKGIAVRIGVNAGSLPLDLRRQAAQGMGGTDIRARALVEAAERELEIFDKLGIPNLLVSMKASGIADTIIANRIFSARNDVPLHIGITEAGPLVEGIARSSAALSLLLSEGIGDTIRISLSDSMESELIAAKEI